MFFFTDSKFKLISGILLFSPFLAINHLAHATPQSASQICSDSEQWSWPIGKYSPKEAWRDEFSKSLTKEGSKIRGFSEALALRRQSQQIEDQAFSAYWISRMFYASGFIHIAEEGFSSLALQPANLRTSDFQMAALGCLISIHQHYPAIPISPKIIPNLINFHHWLSLDSLSIFRGITWKAAFLLYLRNPTLPEADLGKLFDVLRGSGAMENLSQAIQDLKQNESRAALDSFELFLHVVEAGLNHTGLVSNPTDEDTEFLKPYIETAHLLAARSAYQLGLYEKAIHHYQEIGLRSNSRIQALNEIGWSFLMLEKYPEAIGTSIGLQLGPMRQAFAPEAPMVMAMALNEMCRFPESMGAIQNFKVHYRDVYFWLKNEAASPARSSEEIYLRAISFEKKLPGPSVPPQIASEWLRGLNFISNQERLNLIIQEKSRREGMSQRGKKEQKMLTSQLLAETLNIHKKISELNKKNKIDQIIRDSVDRSIRELKLKLVHLKRLRIAGKFWRKIMNHDASRAISTRKVIIQDISREITKLNQNLLAQLDEIAENNELVEVEILNGASDDMIWQNAHPQFREVTEKIVNQAHKKDTASVWNWGLTHLGTAGSGEIWEDEIGSLSADLTDECENRDRYLQVEQRESR